MVQALKFLLSVMSLSLLSSNSIDVSTSENTTVQKHSTSQIEISKEGETYNGPLVNGLKQGEGKLQWSTGQVYFLYNCYVLYCFS